MEFFDEDVLFTKIERFNGQHRELGPANFRKLSEHDDSQNGSSFTNSMADATAWPLLPGGCAKPVEKCNPQRQRGSSTLDLS